MSDSVMGYEQWQQSILDAEEATRCCYGAFDNVRLYLPGGRFVVDLRETMDRPMTDVGGPELFLEVIPVEYQATRGGRHVLASSMTQEELVVMAGIRRDFERWKRGDGPFPTQKSIDQLAAELASWNGSDPLRVAVAPRSTVIDMAMAHYALQPDSPENARRIELLCEACDIIEDARRAIITPLDGEK